MRTFIKQKQDEQLPEKIESLNSGGSDIGIKELLNPIYPAAPAERN